MSNESYSIVYSSTTGNTKLLADAIYGHLPEAKCCYFGPTDAGAVDSEMVYVGFWTNQGTADEKTLSFLKNIKGKKVFLFGTAGFNDEAYFKQIIEKVKQAVTTDNDVVGAFMCQGKMRMSVRERYVSLKEQGAMPNADEMIANFDKALSHPDEADVAALINAIEAV